MADGYRYALTPALPAEGEDIVRHLPVPPRMQAWFYPRAITALTEVFRHHLGEDGVATIFTSSNARYVSSCLTDAVAAAGGQWSRTFEENTRLVVVVHEWGFYCADTAAIANSCRRRGVPLVEDYAYATGLFFADAPVHGDYIVLSLRKFFGESAGGVLLAVTDFAAAGGGGGDFVPGEFACFTTGKNQRGAAPCLECVC